MLQTCFHLVLQAVPFHCAKCADSIFTEACCHILRSQFASASFFCISGFLLTTDVACRHVILHSRECFAAEVLVLQRSFVNSLGPPIWQMRRLVLHSTKEWQTIVVYLRGERRDAAGLFFASGVLCSKRLVSYLFVSLVFASCLVSSFAFSSSAP